MPSTKATKKKAALPPAPVADVPKVSPDLITPPVQSVEPSVPEAPKKKGKKVPKVVAVVTPNGIEGSFLPEPRRPLIAHLQINTANIKFHDTPLFYDPNPPGQPEPYDSLADNMFCQQNAEIDGEVKALAKANDNPAEKEEFVEEQPVAVTSTPVKAKTASLEAFTKCDLMVEYKGLVSTKKIPEKTNIACFWCAHNFTWQPCVIPEREEKGIYRVYGNFCCASCAMAFLLQESLDTHVRWDRIALLHRLYGKWYAQQNGRIFPAPARESLRLFGGHLDIEEYRETIGAGKIRMDIAIPPMVSILGSIDTKPIDFYDSSMKHTISPLLGEMVPKAEEGLRLKRSKPLKEKDSTLDSVLKIQIRGRA